MKPSNGHTILLGGIGGDSHSVGLSILRQSLLMQGYNVHFMGTQNRLGDFFEMTAFANVVMISCMDGHARYYLRQFPDFSKRWQARNVLWYLGGNVQLDDDPGGERYFLEMGFDRVFLRFVEVQTVLDALKQDLLKSEPAFNLQAKCGKAEPKRIHQTGSLADGVLDGTLFERQRSQVLESWKTGSPARDFDENAEFLLRQPSFSAAQSQVAAGHLPILIQPRSGVPRLAEQLEIFRAFKSCGIRVLSYQVDSLTRNNDYAGAEEAIRESQSMGQSRANGFPLVNHGVQGLRRISSQLKLPLQTRHSARDPRLLAEISYAGGVTSFEGGPICYNIPYYKDYSLAEAIANWRYVDRLTGLYRERYGINLDREFFGTLTATLVPPCLAIAVNILETILAVQQGVRCFSLGYAEQGNRAQDIAAIRTLRSLSEEALSNLGYRNVQVNTVFHQYMAAFPEESKRAEELIYNSAITARLSGATRILIKTPAEAFRVPRLADNLHALSLVMRAVAEAEKAEFDEERVTEESSIIEREVRAILDKTIFCGNGDVAQGIISAFHEGFIDIPFSPSIYNRGSVMTARDKAGAVRFLSCGRLPFDRELRDFHQCKMDERRRSEGLLSARQDYLLVEKDVLQIQRGRYECWPLGA